MKTTFFLTALLICGLKTSAQNEKFSVEVNYPLVLSNGSLKSNGIIDASLKFRFKETNTLHLGAGYIFDYVEASQNVYNNNIKRDYFFHHLNLFTELKLDTAKRFRPFFGIGYTLLSGTNEYVHIDNGFLSVKNENMTNSGFNFNIGLSYDLLKRFFVQAYFHYIRVFNESPFEDDKIGINYNQIKIGLGYRF